MKKLRVAGIVGLLLAPFCCADDKNPAAKPAQSIAELQHYRTHLFRD